MNKIYCQSPTRVDLAGGTLDLWPLHLLVGSSYTINFAIDVFTHAQIQKRSDGRVNLTSVDRDMSREYSSVDEFLKCSDEDWRLVRQHVLYWNPPSGFDLETGSDSPIGGGLGGSSSLSISLIKAFSQFCDKKLSGAEMVELAGNVEAQVLRTPTGTQDYYPPIYGGMNIIFYGCDGEKVEVFDIPQDIFSQRFFLVYTGRPHHSGLNNWSVMKEAIEANPQTLQCLEELKQISDRVRDVCLDQQWDLLGPLLKEEFHARVGLCAEVSSPEIQQLEQVALENGAEAVKICGAGGGGCVMVWASPSQIEKAKTSCRELGYQVMDAQPVPPFEKSH